MRIRNGSVVQANVVVLHVTDYPNEQADRSQHGAIPLPLRIQVCGTVFINALSESFSYSFSLTLICRQCGGSLLPSWEKL